MKHDRGKPTEFKSFVKRPGKKHDRGKPRSGAPSYSRTGLAPKTVHIRRKVSQRMPTRGNLFTEEPSLGRRPTDAHKGLPYSTERA